MLKRKILLIVVIIVGIIIILPIGGVAYFLVSCSYSSWQLDRRASKVEEQMLNLASKYSDIEAKPNGDCITGSGVSLRFIARTNNSSFYEEKDKIFSELANVGIPSPNISTNPEFIFAEDGNSSGGNTPIKRIRVTYPNIDGSRYDLSIELPNKIPCAVIDSSTVLCNGEEKEALINEILSTTSIDEIYVSADIYR